jgi:hypothetical protein
MSTSTRPTELKNLADCLQQISDHLAGFQSAIRDCRKLVETSDSAEAATAAVAKLLQSIPSPDDRSYPFRPYEVWLIDDVPGKPEKFAMRFESITEATRQARAWNKEIAGCTAIIRTVERGAA